MPIDKSVLDFLKKLKKNNDREWFKKNDKEYKKAKEEVLKFAEGFMEKAFPEMDKADIDPKKTLFRIHRDIRFSNDKTPYKDHFGLVLHPEGRKTQAPALYLHISPDRAMVAAGLWRPDKDMLYKIRQEIDYSDKEFTSILKNLKGGFELDREDSLQRPPKGYDKENENINYIKLKSFVLVKALESKDLSEKGFDSKLLKDFRNLSEFLSFLERATQE